VAHPASGNRQNHGKFAYGADVWVELAALAVSGNLTKTSRIQVLAAELVINLKTAKALGLSLSPIVAGASRRRDRVTALVVQPIWTNGCCGAISLKKSGLK
jgi:hypothetical protein